MFFMEKLSILAKQVFKSDAMTILNMNIPSFYSKIFVLGILIQGLDTKYGLSIDAIQREDKKRILNGVTGDFNVDLLSYNNHIMIVIANQTADYFDIFMCNNFIPLITLPTMVTTQSGYHGNDTICLVYVKFNPNVICTSGTFVLEFKIITLIIYFSKRLKKELIQSKF